MIRVAFWTDSTTGRFRAWCLLEGREFTAGGTSWEIFCHAVEETIRTRIPAFLSFSVEYVKLGTFNYLPTLEQAREWAQAA